MDHFSGGGVIFFVGGVTFFVGGSFFLSGGPNFVSTTVCLIENIIDTNYKESKIEIMNNFYLINIKNKIINY